MKTSMNVGALLQLTAILLAGVGMQTSDAADAANNAPRTTINQINVQNVQKTVVRRVSLGVPARNGSSPSHHGPCSPPSVPASVAIDLPSSERKIKSGQTNKQRVSAGQPNQWKSPPIQAMPPTAAPVSVNAPRVVVSHAPANPMDTRRAPPDSNAKSLDEMSKQMLQMIRQARGPKNPICVDPALTKAAQEYATTLKARPLSHQGIYGSNPTQRVKNAGFSGSYTAENLADNPSLAGAHQALMQSSGHRQNILNVNLNKIGVGFAKKTDGNLIVVQNFGRSDGPCGDEPPTSSRQLTATSGSIINAFPGVYLIAMLLLL